MTTGIDHRNTASVAVGKVFEALPSRALLAVPRAELWAAEEAAEREIFFALCRAYERPRRERLQDMLEAATSSHRYEELAGIDERDLEPDGKPVLLAFAEELEETAAEARALFGHAHVWGENDLCATCGADGRV